MPEPTNPPPDEQVSDPERTDLLFSAGATDPGQTPPPGRGAKEGTDEGPAREAFPAAVGRFRVEREIARGGMGVIYAARDPALGRDVALKVMLEAHAGRPGYRERFVAEARTTGALQHPGVVPVYDLGDLPDGRPFFAMRLVGGTTLDAQLAARTGAGDELSHFLHVFERVCQALAYAHSRGVIHCDLKPQNVMAGPFGVVKVMDWGLARALRGPPDGTHEGDHPHPAGAQDSHTGGTPSYLSPEQANAGPLDERTDVFGLGGILCAVLTGRPVYLGQTTKRAFAQASRADLSETFARLGGSGAPAELIDLAKRCLAPHPGGRPQNAQAVAAALTAYLESDLRRAERDLVRFFELTPDLLCVAGLDGYFRRVNGNFTRVLGYPAELLLARPFVEFVHPDDRPGTVAETEKLARGLPVVQFRNRYRDVNGNYRWFEWAAQSIPEERVVFAVARDITDRLELERRLSAGTDPGPPS